MGDLVIIPAPAGFGDYVALAGTTYPGATGAVFRKHILNLGPLHYKGKTFNLDDEWYAQMERNFAAKVSMTQVPLADKDNRHTEDPRANTGEIIGLQREGNKVYDVIDVRDPDIAQRIRDRRIMGASAFLNMDYLDTRTDARVGPALLHHCLTNRPHVLDLEPYEEIVAATADMEWDATEPVVLAQEDVSMTKEELLAQLKAEHGIDIEALQLAAQAKTDAAALTSQIVDALKGSGALQLTGESIDADTITGAIVELTGVVRQQGSTIDELKHERAEGVVNGYISAGRLLPKSKARAVELALTDPEALEDFLSPVKEPYVRLDHQEGFNAPDGEGKHREDVDAELVRLTKEHAEMFERGQDRSGSVPKRS